MAIAFDAASTGNVNPATSLTVSHTCSGSDRILFVGVVGAPDSDLITGATYNGTAMTLVTKVGASNQRWLYLFALIGPATGANNIVVSASTSSYIEINAASYTGVEQTGQPTAYASDATDKSQAVTTTADNSWVVGAALDNGGSLGGGSGTTQRATTLVGAVGDSGSAVTPAGSKTLTFTGAASFQAIIVAAFAPAAASDTINVTTPAQYKVHQRSGSTGSISISGTYSGTPTSIEASFNGGAYATIVASPAGGTFSGTLSGQAQGQGSLTVRFSNATGVNATVADVGIGDVFVIGGDSISEGKATNAQSYSHATLKAVKFTQADVWGNGSDPIDTNTTNGSHWPLLATQIMASQGVPVAFISCGTGSTDVAGSHNEWAKNNSAYAEMVSQVSASGVNAVKGVLLHLGPNAVVNASTLSLATYNAALDQLASDIAADIAGSPTLCIGIFGEVSTGSPPDRRTAIDNLRGAILQAHGDNANIKPGPCLIDQDYSDGVHPATDAELQAVAARWWLALSETFYGGSGGRGPRLSLARWNGARNQLTVVFDRALKTGLSFGAGAWAVKDNGSAMTVSSVSYHGTNANAVVLSTSAAATGGAGTTTLSLGSGNDAMGVVIPKSADISMPSGAAAQLPAEPILAAAVGEAPTISVTLTSDGSTPVASASSLKWAWFDQATPDAFNAPTDQGAAESTDGSGVLAITLANSAKVSGQVGWLIVTNSDGTPTQSPAHKAFSGPVAIS